MIELYTWSTPNGQKVSIMPEEVGLPYRVHPIDIGKGHQFHPDFLAISPNNKIPAIIDTDNGLQLKESGAILLYLAEKTGKLWPQDFPTKWRVVEWLMWQMGGPGPFLGQVHHFVKFNPGKSAYAEERYTKEARRLWSVLDRRLAEHEYVADDYSIADMLSGLGFRDFEWQTVTFDDYPNVKRWYVAIAARPAVQTAWHVPPRDRGIPMP
jgi:GST-like protein